MLSTQLLNKCRWRLNRLFNIAESVKNVEKKLVESVLSQIYIGLNLHSTSINIFFALENVEWRYICPTSIQLLLNECWTIVETVKTGL